MADTPFTSYYTDNDKKFAKALKKVGERLNDLTLPLNLIANDFYKSERAIFKLKSEGQYPPLGGLKPTRQLRYRGADMTAREVAELRKKEQVGFAYPLLKRTGLLERSLVNRSDINAVNDILGKKTLVIGTLVEYGIYHQSDENRTKIPLRKFLFIGPEASKFATSEQMGRLERWRSILSDYLSKMIAKGN